MGRIFIILGIIAIIAGFVIPFIGVNSFLEPIMNIAGNTSARAAELCKDGETLKESAGTTTYRPGSGYGRTVRYFCVNASGEEREVTGEIIDDIITGALKGISAGAGPMVLSTVLSLCGTPLLILGIILSVRGRNRNMQPNMMTINGMPVTGSSSFFPQQPQQPQQNIGGDLAARLNQLEQAYKNNLITREEYERMRGEIMNKPF
jgi:hypothetical protein